jgi:hypothetical protein
MKRPLSFDKFLFSAMQCNSEGCQTTFHPSCARDAGFYMNIKGFGTTLQHKAYCAKHSTEQKEASAASRLFWSNPFLSFVPTTRLIINIISCQ